jgi:hypothetical protein
VRGSQRADERKALIVSILMRFSRDLSEKFRIDNGEFKPTARFSQYEFRVDLVASDAPVC